MATLVGKKITLNIISSETGWVELTPWVGTVPQLPTILVYIISAQSLGVEYCVSVLLYEPGWGLDL